MMFLFLICVFCGLLLFIAGILYVIYEFPDSFGGFVVAMILFSLCLYGADYAVKSAPQYALDHGTVITEYAQVTTISTDSIAVDGHSFKIENDAVHKKYPVDISNYKIGDVVRVEILTGDMFNYLIGIDPYPAKK